LIAATFRLDSFGGRGIDHVLTDQSRLSLFAQFYDTYRAVDVLAAHPGIDPSRIAVMGFSRGGSAALYTSMYRFQHLHGPTKTRIAAHLPFYPACNIQFIGELDVANAPIREFHGTADDATLAATCRDYITRVNAAGKDAFMTEYPGAHHGFDDPNARPGLVNQSEQTSRNCQRREEDGKIVNVETGKPFTWNDSCVEFGPTSGYDKAATEAARRREEIFDGNISAQLIWPMLAKLASKWKWNLYGNLPVETRCLKSRIALTRPETGILRRFFDPKVDCFNCFHLINGWRDTPIEPRVSNSADFMSI
jgi:dienelactone hydrolase